MVAIRAVSMELEVTLDGGTGGDDGDWKNEAERFKFSQQFDAKRERISSCLSHDKSLGRERTHYYKQYPKSVMTSSGLMVVTLKRTDVGSRSRGRR